MNRIIEIEIAGTSYPLNFSVKAAKELTKRYGALDKIGEALSIKKTDELFDELMYLLALLQNQGADYANIMEGKEIRKFSPEQLEVIMGTVDCVALQDRLMEAMAAGMKPTVETEDTSEEKNARTTQGQ